MKSITFFKHKYITIDFILDTNFYNNCIHKIDTEIFKIYLLKYFHNNIYDDKINFFFKLLNTYTYESKRNKVVLQTLKSFKLFYFITGNYANMSLTKYQFWNEYKYNMAVNFYVYNILFILNWLLLTLKPLFTLKCQIVPKKYRKHFKTNYLYRMVYLQPNKRFNTALKWIGNEIICYPASNNSEKIIFTLLDLILNFKSSILYKKKIKIYTYLLKLK